MFEGIKNGLKDSIINSLTGLDSMVNGAKATLMGTGGLGNFNADQVWNAVLALSDILKPFCYIVIILCLLIEMAKVLTRTDVLKWEMGLKVGVKMVLARVCIDIAPTFLRACYNQANIWISAVANNSSFSMGATVVPKVENYLNSVSGTGEILGLWASMIIVTLAIKICGILISVIAIGRMFEIYVYLAVSPLPCAFFPLGDGAGGGISRVTEKFFKSFIAVCLQGVMMLICITIYNMIVSNSFASMINGITTTGSAAVSEVCYTVLMFAIVLVMSIARCGSWAKNIVDAM